MAFYDTKVSSLLPEITKQVMISEVICKLKSLVDHLGQTSEWATHISQESAPRALPLSPKLIGSGDRPVA